MLHIILDKQQIIIIKELKEMKIPQLEVKRKRIIAIVLINVKLLKIILINLHQNWKFFVIHNKFKIA